MDRQATRDFPWTGPYISLVSVSGQGTTEGSTIIDAVKCTTLEQITHLSTMITLRTLLATSVLASCTLAAQDKDKHEDRWNGLRAGYHLSNFEGDKGSTTSRNGYYGGYFRNIIKVPLYRLSTGLEFNTAGSASGDDERRLSYLSLPINNRFKFGPVYLDIGLDAALKVGEKNVVDGAEVELPKDAKAERLDVLVHGGAGFKFLFLSVEARYRYGLIEVYDGAHNAGLQLGLSAFF